MQLVLPDARDPEPVPVPPALVLLELGPEPCDLDTDESLEPFDERLVLLEDDLRVPVAEVTVLEATVAVEVLNDD